MSCRGFVWLTVFAAGALALLVGLGVWQLQRLAWKEGLIDRIEQRAHGESVTIEEALRRWNESGDVEYLRVRLEGRFRHEDELHVYSIFNSEAGWRVVTPLLTSGGRVVLVDRGFVPQVLKEPGKRRQGLVEGVVTVTGLVRAPEGQGAFVPDNDIARNIWYWRDMDAMAQAALSLEEASRLAPFFVEAENVPVPGGWPRGGVTRLELPNRHLEYAVTWFGLAGTLVAVYVFLVFGRTRKRT